MQNYPATKLVKAKRVPRANCLAPTPPVPSVISVKFARTYFSYLSINKHWTNRKMTRVNQLEAVEDATNENSNSD